MESHSSQINHWQQPVLEQVGKFGAAALHGASSMGRILLWSVLALVFFSSCASAAFTNATEVGNCDLNAEGIPSACM